MKLYKRIYLELTGGCNLACPFCHGNIRQNIFVSRENLQRIIPQIAELTDEIRPHVLGEPLLYPEFGLFLDLCRQNNLSVKITTNGTMLDPSSSALMSAPCVKEINFSVQSYSSGTHGDPDSYITALFNYAENTAAAGNGQYINYRFWTTDGGVFSSEQKKLYDLLLGKYGIPADQSMIANRSLRLAERRRISFDETFQWPGLAHPHVSDKGRCNGAVSHIGILSDGSVIPCCLDAEGIITLGNVFEDNLRDIAKCSRLENIRKGFLRGEKVEELCRRCLFSTRFPV